MKGKKISTNGSKTYLLPLLSEFVNLDTKFILRIQNTFIQDSENKYKDCIYIMHNFNYKDKDYTKVEHNLMNNKLFVQSYDIDDRVLYIFKCPPEYIHEYEMYKQSKYSKYGKDAKELVLEFWATIYKNVPTSVKFLSKIKNILFKELKLKKELERKLSTKGHPVIIKDDAELGEYVNIDNETFDYTLTKIELNDDIIRKM